ncbi:MAG TPA: NAD(P)/FAD-dependent oxidoreductase [Solirubrobacteraceae bacterium]
MSDYDAIVVGAGLGGLSAAAFLACAGQRVLVCERSESPGGLARGLQRGQHRFNTAVYTADSGESGGRLDVLLRHLGVRDRLTLTPVDPLYTVRLPGFQLDAPPDNDAFLDLHAKRFPDSAADIRGLFAACTQLFEELRDLERNRTPRGLGGDLGDAVSRYPTVFRFSRSTLDEVLREYIGDPRARAVLAATWPALGLAPSRAAFMPWAGMMISALHGGQVYCQGGFQVLIDGLVTALAANGGELRVSSEVTAIRLARGVVTGVELADGSEAGAPIVISGIDALDTFERLLDPEQLEARFLKRLGRMKPSSSAFVLYSASRMDLPDVAQEMFVFSSWDHEEHDIERLAVRLAIPTLADPSLAPAGEHLVTATVLAPYEIGEPWETAAGPLTDRLLSLIDGVLPGYRKGLTFTESATPVTLGEASRNARGAAYGWDGTPQQSGSKRLRHDPPVPGLFLSGHWTQPGIGIGRIVYSGAQAAQLALGMEQVSDLVPTLVTEHYQRARSSGSTSSA